jgi:hypothetical protein
VAGATEQEKETVTAPNRAAELGWTLFGTAVLAAVLAAAAGLAIVAGGETPRTSEAVAFAATICLAGGVGGWIVARWPTTNPASGVAKSLGAVTLRIFLPLVAMGWLQAGGGWLREAGADRFVLIFYLALLATDILLHIMGDRELRRIRGKKSPD